MDTTVQRKTDRRTLYSRMIIKEALLSIMKTKEYGQITVTDLCREAEISRGTFYTHYDNLSQVIDALFDDVLDNTHSILKQIGYEADKDPCAYPLCVFLRENKKYQPLFFSDALYTQAIDRISKYGFEHFAERMQKSSELTREELFALFTFQLGGCLSVCKRNIHVADEQWEQVQCSIDLFLKNGFQNL